MKPLTVCLLLAASYAFAQRGPAPEPTAVRATAAPATPIPPETSSVTDHDLSLDGKTVHYSATAGTLLIDGDDSQPNATVFLCRVHHGRRQRSAHQAGDVPL